MIKTKLLGKEMEEATDKILTDVSGSVDRTWTRSRWEDPVCSTSSSCTERALES